MGAGNSCLGSGVFVVDLEGGADQNSDSDLAQLKAHIAGDIDKLLHPLISRSDLETISLLFMSGVAESELVSESQLAFARKLFVECAEEERIHGAWKTDEFRGHRG